MSSLLEFMLIRVLVEHPTRNQWLNKNAGLLIRAQAMS